MVGLAYLDEWLQTRRRRLKFGPAGGIWEVAIRHPRYGAIASSAARRGAAWAGFTIEM